jgi:hypothetical protein
MKYLAFKSKKKVNSFIKIEILRHRLLLLRRFYSMSNDLCVLYKIQYLLSKLKNSQRIRFRCLINNYAKTYRLFRMSRFGIKTQLACGDIVGLKKSA